MSQHRARKGKGESGCPLSPDGLPVVCRQERVSVPFQSQERVSVPSHVDTFFLASSSVNHTDVTDFVSV